jgi:hypothetical protein
VAKILKIFRTFLLVCLFLGMNTQAPSAMAQKTDSTPNQLSQVESAETNSQIYQTIPDSYNLVGENDTFQLYANKTTLAF